MPRAGACASLRDSLSLGGYPRSLPASLLLRPHPTTALAYATGSSPKFPCRTFEARAPACAPFGFGLRRRFPSSSALRCILARPPKFLTELSRRVVLLCPAAPARPKPIRALGVGFTASELLAARNSSNETLRRRFTCVVAYSFVWRDSRTSVALCTACPPNRMSISWNYCKL